MTRNHHHPGGAVPADGYWGNPARRPPARPRAALAGARATGLGQRRARSRTLAARAPQGYLWTLFVYARQEQSSDLLRTAFEVGFLTRLQQGVGQMPLDGLAYRF
jgi:hypothetical protein